MSIIFPFHRITLCGHVYCYSCITKFIESVPNPPVMCPLCREHIEKKSLLEAATEEDNEGKEETEDDEIIEADSTKVNAVLEEMIRNGIEFTLS